MKKLHAILLLSSIALAACTGHNGRFDLTKPVSLDMRPPEGPINYQQGWSDGCESSLASTNDKIQLFLATHKYTYDPVLRHDFLYKKAWNYGFLHCGFSMKSMAQYNFL